MAVNIPDLPALSETIDSSTDLIEVYNNSAGENQKASADALTKGVFSGATTRTTLNTTDEFLFNRSSANEKITKDNLAVEIMASNKPTNASTLSFDSGTTKWKFVELEIGDWNMNANQTLDKAHGLSSTEWKTVRDIQALIRNDNDTQYDRIDRIDGTSGASDGSAQYIDSTNIRLLRKGSGTFDSTSYDSTTYNRGWITFWYKPD